MAKKKKGRGPSGSRSYARLTRHERNSIEQMLDQAKSCRAIAKALGRAPSTISNEVARHRFFTSPKARYGQIAPDKGLGEVCERLGSWPACCNACKRRRAYGCKNRPHVFYFAKMAQAMADAELSESRRGIDGTEIEVSFKLSVVKADLARGLSPAQIAATRAEELNVSASTIYRWCELGYANLTNMDLRRKVGYKPRRHTIPKKPTTHPKRRSHASFLALEEDVRASAWEMDTVLGTKADTSRLLTLLHRPSRFQLVLPIEDGSCVAVNGALEMVGSILGQEGMQRVFSVVLTDNGSEFADDTALGKALGERPGETRLFYCDPMRSQQKGACEKNHVEVRKLLPKGKGIRFDLLTRTDCAQVMSQINSEPRGCLAWMRPIDVFLAAFGADAEALLDALGVEVLSADELNLTPACIEKAREERGEAPLAQ